MVALGTGPNANTLYRFSGESPGTTGSVPVVGLGVSTLAGIDYRPASGELYGLGVNGDVASLFTINLGTGVATLVGSPATVLSITGATAYGIAFNPAADRLRVVNNLASEVGLNTNNFRLNPNNGSLAGSDSDLNFSGLPGGAAEAPEVAVAYDRDFAGTTATTLFGIVSGGDRLVMQGGVNSVPSANGGQLFNVGPLGIDVTNNTGFDIDPATGEAYMAARVAGLTGFYRVDLGTGTATGVGQIGDGLVDLTSLTIGGPPFSPPMPPSPAEPKLEALSVSPKRFAAVRGGPTLKATGSTVAAPRGTTVSYSISAPATVAFAVEHKTVGRKVGKVCKRETKGNRSRKPCPRWQVVPRSDFTHRGLAGSNSFPYNGRIRSRVLTPRSKPLASGSYRLLAQLGSTTLVASFKVVPAIPGLPR